jgi:Meckel syndrome type 1 protein
MQTASSTAVSASAASGAVGIPQSPSSSQQPSAVAQFTGRSKAGSQTFATARSASPGQTQAASPPPGIGAVKDGAGPSADRVGDVAAAPASDAAQGDQTAPSSGQNTASTDVGSDAAAQQATLSAAVQTGPAADAPIAGASAASATIANLSAQIAQKAGGQTTRFDVQLDPIGLGRVNVSVEIDAKGAMSAALSFEKPEAASLLKSHSAELQQSLAQAGFDLSNGALSFSTADQGGRGGAGQAAFLGAGANDGGGQQSQGGQAQTAGRAFGAASFAADQADQISTTARTLSARGLDIRI